MQHSSSNRNFIIISALIAGVFLIYGILNFNRAFPETAVNFKLSRKAALNCARDFLIGRSFGLQNYRETIVFSYDEQTKLFLEKQLGVERMNTLARDSIDVWRWEARFFKPQELLEYSVQVDPGGRITGFNRKMPESAKGPILDTETALTLAEAFIVGPMGVELKDWILIESENIGRPDRRDHSFTYEQKNSAPGGASYRMEVEVQGAQVGGFRRYLVVPQEWQREYTASRSLNVMLHGIANILYVIISIVIFIYFIINVYHRQFKWRFIIIISIILAVVTAATNLNSLPLALFKYQTFESSFSFIVHRILFSLIAGLGTGALVLVLYGAGERLYRKDNPDKLYIPRLFSRGGIQTREFFQATLMGYILAAFHIGFIVFFYVTGRKFGFWSPAQVNYDNTVSTLLPWLFPLAISMTAALTEEFWFRLFGIAFFRRIFKSVVLAVIFQALIWGFFHSNYPQQPGFVRGIELTLIGIAAGFVMLRFGIWATLTWHFVVNAVLVGLFLFRSDSAYFWISGLIVCGGLSIPSLIAGLIYLRRRKFEPMDDMLNSVADKEFVSLADSPTGMSALLIQNDGADTELVRDDESKYRPLSRRIRKVVLIIGALCILLALLPKPRQFGDDLTPVINRREAVRIAGAALQERYLVSPDSFGIGIIHSQRYSAKWDTLRSYLKKHTDMRSAEDLLLSPSLDASPHWLVSFKRELDQVQYQVWVSQLVGTTTITRVIPDSALGADLSVEEARTIAEMIFEQTESFPERYELIKGSSNKFDHRLDHYFTWESIEPVLGELHYQRQLKLIGDEVLIGNRTVRIPEEWRLHEKEKGLRGVLLNLLLALLIIGIVLVFIRLRNRLKPRGIHWRSGVFIGVTVLILGVFNQVNDWGSFWLNYPTSVSFNSFAAMKLLATSAQLLLTSLFVTIVVMTADTILQARYAMQSWFWGSDVRLKLENGIILMLGTIGIGFGLLWFFNYLELSFNLPVHSYSLLIPSNLDMYLPWFSLLYEALLDGLIIASLTAIVFTIIDVGIRSVILRSAVLILLSVACARFIVPISGNPNYGELLWSMVQTLVIVATGYMVLKYWIKGRLWVLVASWLMAALIHNGLIFLDWGDTPYKLQGWWLLIMAAIITGGMFVGALRTKAR